MPPLLSLENSGNSNARARVGDSVETREVRDIATGKIVVVDDRTFDATQHEDVDAAAQRAEAAKSAKTAGAKGSKGKATDDDQPPA